MNNTSEKEKINISEDSLYFVYKDYICFLTSGKGAYIPFITTSYLLSNESSRLSILGDPKIKEFLA